MKNYRTGFLCLITAFLLPLVAMAQVQTDGQDADTSGNAGVNQTRSDITGPAAEFIRTSADIWSNVPRMKTAADAMILAIDASKMLEVAPAGHLYTANSAIEKAQTFVEKEQQMLGTLAGKKSIDWVRDSGFNAFNASTMPAAQDYLDGWTQRLTSLQSLIQQFIPLVRTAETVSANSALQGGRMFKGESTLVAGDPAALEEIISALSSSGRDIEVILEQARLARLVAVDAVNPASMTQSTQPTQQTQNVQSQESSGDQADAEEADGNQDDQDAETDQDETNAYAATQQLYQQTMQNLSNMMQNNVRMQNPPTIQYPPARSGGRVQPSQCVGERCY